MEAIADPPAYDRARAAVRYDEVARALVLSFKYGDRLDLAPMMGQWMARAGRELLKEADALLPVPLHWRRLWARRFNQSAALAKAISGMAGVPVLHGALKRVRATPQQVGLSKSERADNVQGAFRVPAEEKPHVERPPAGADRRRAHLRGNRRHLRPRAAAGGRRPCRRAGLCPGCRRHTHSHITRAGTTRSTVMPPVEIYTTRYCPYCNAAKALLNRKGVTFTEIDVSGDRQRREEMVERANGGWTVPQIFIGATHVGGCDELHALEDAGKLDPLLAGDEVGA